MFLVYDLLTGEIVQELHGHESCVRDVSWHPYHQELISASVRILFTIKNYSFFSFIYFILCKFIIFILQWDGVIGCWRYSSFPQKNTEEFE